MYLYLSSSPPNTLLGSQRSIEEAVYLNLSTSVDLSKLKTSEGCTFHSKVSESVAALEDLVSGWCQQIEQVSEKPSLLSFNQNEIQVLAEGSQIRKEADDTGPLTELEYWKQRTAKFSCLVDMIKTQPCRGVITTLVAAKSKVIKVPIIQVMI